MYISGSAGSSSFGLLSWSTPVQATASHMYAVASSSCLPQQAPSQKRPWTKAPSGSASVRSSGERTEEMCVSVVILSKGSAWFLAVTCLMAVRKAVGLKRPGSHNASGARRLSASAHLESCAQRRMTSSNQLGSPFIEGQAKTSHDAVWNGLRPGTCRMDSAESRSSIFCDMFSWPSKPFFSSSSDRAISAVRSFIRPSSCSTTTR
mmetsp:Transcript_17794/g.60079  ORF Transcript_17794/g.60079 Transcript_17794/m.60079 type:complete len:206 (-) Transcript_17794:7051-7668(-)